MSGAFCDCCGFSVLGLCSLWERGRLLCEHCLRGREARRAARARTKATGQCELSLFGEEL